MSKKRQTLAQVLNQHTARVIFDRLRLIAVNAFTWEGLPDGILERHVETLLFDHGLAVFFKAANMGHMVLQATPGGNLNVYGDPLYYHATGHGYHQTLQADDCVIIGNNLLRLSTWDFAMFWTNKLAEVERTMDVNVKAVKTPVVFTCDDKDLLTWKALFHQVDGNVPAAFVDRGLNVDSVKAFQTGAKFLGNELMDYKHSIENEALTFLGLNNLPTDKKERLITDEANANNQLIQSFIDMQLDARIRACEEIKMKFGVDVSVKKRTTVEKPVEEVENHDRDV